MTVARTTNPVAIASRNDSVWIRRFAEGNLRILALLGSRALGCKSLQEG